MRYIPALDPESFRPVNDHHIGDWSYMILIVCGSLCGAWLW